MVLEGSRLFNWSVLVTPVRPLNLTQQFKERWAQLSGPANCTCAAAPFWLSPSLTEAVCADTQLAYHGVCVFFHPSRQAAV